MRIELALLSLLIPANAFSGSLSLTGPTIQQLRKEADGLPIVPVAAAGEGTRIDLNGVDTYKDGTDRVDADDALKRYGITVVAGPGTRVTVIKNKDVYGGGVFNIPLTAALISHDGGTGRVQYALIFDPPVDSVHFTRPELFGGESGIIFPAWLARAFSGEREVARDGENLIRYFDPNSRPNPANGKWERPKGIPAMPYPAKEVELAGNGEKITRLVVDGNGAGAAALNNVALWRISIRRSP